MNTPTITISGGGPPLEAEFDYYGLREETRRDLREAKIGLAQLLVIEVIFDYSFAVQQAAAWLPSFDVFVLRTGMGKKEVGTVLAKLESYGILEWEPAPEEEFPHGRRYKVFPRRTRAWSIAPRVPDLRLQERAAKMDRWLRALNASGGPAQGDLFPPKWDHADTLAEWQASPQNDTPIARSDRTGEPKAAVESSTFQVGSPDANPASLGRGLTPPGSSSVGKNPTRGEKPHAPINGWSEFNERDLSFNPNQSIEWEPTVGKNPTLPEEDEDRPEDWPSREVENRLMRRIAELVHAFYAGEKAAEVMTKFGAIWRWRIRQWPFAVEQAIDRTTAQWSEVKKLGGFLNREWSKVWRKRAEMSQAGMYERTAEPDRTEPADWS